VVTTEPTFAGAETAVDGPVPDATPVGPNVWARGIAVRRSRATTPTENKRTVIGRRSVSERRRGEEGLDLTRVKGGLM
jgi:hypothetical protein